jgi:nucleoside-diphosphate-sugar epimerase
VDVFLTGGSGYLGTVLVEHLVGSGHTVHALARSDRSAARLTALGATPVPGDLNATGVLTDAAARADAVVHAAIDDTDPRMGELEAGALAALLDRASGKPFVYASTGLVYPFLSSPTSEAFTEDHPVEEATAAQPHKVAGERTVLAAGDVLTTVVRAALVHGRGGSGLVEAVVGLGRRLGSVPYVGDGSQTWSAVHVDDLADLFVLALTRPQRGLVVNAAAEATFEIRELARWAARHTGTEAVSRTPEEAIDIAPQLAVLGADLRQDATRARTTFGWRPTRASILDDLRSAAYAGT